MAEQRAPIIAFVWRPEEIIPPVIQMAHRTGSRAIFDVSTLGVEALRPFLRKADPAGQVRDIKISASDLDWIHLWDHGWRKPGSKISG